MARNQFRPGQSPLNPLYPGYYPGRRMPLKPRPRGPESAHFTGFGAGDSVSEFLDSFDKEIKGKLKGTLSWIPDRYADDFEQSLKINSMPPQGVPIEALDDYETGSLPGGGFIQLNIDPREWLGIGQRGKKWLNEDGTVNRDKEAPKKMIRKTLAKWAKYALDFEDLETMARTEFWDAVLKDEYSPSEHTALENAAYKASVGEDPKEIYVLDEFGKPKIENRKKVRIEGMPANPYALNNKGIYESVSRTTEKRYLPDENGNLKEQQVFVERQTIFTDSSDQVVITEKANIIGGKALPEKSWLETVDKDTRNAWKYDSNDVFEKEFVSAKNYLRESRNPTRRDLTFDLAQSDAVHAASVEMRYMLATQGGAAVNPDVASFISRSELSPAIGELGKALFEGNRDMRLSLVANLNLTHDQLNNIQDKLKDIGDKYHNLENALSSVGRDVLIARHGSGLVAELDTNMKNLKKIIDSEDFKIIMRVDTSLKNVRLPEGITSKVRGVLKDLNTSPGVWTIVKTGGLIGGSTLKPSVQRALNADLSGEMCLNKLESYIVGNNLEGSQSLVRLIPWINADRGFEVLDELEDTLTGGHAAEAIIWTRGMGRLSDRTAALLSPKVLVERIKSKVNNFGLILNDKQLKNKGYWWKDTDKPNGLFGNRFSVSFSAKVKGKETKVKVKTWGGDHYKIVTKMERWMNNARDKIGLFTEQQLKDLLCNDKNILQPWITKGIKPDQLIRVGGKWKYKTGRVVTDIFSPEFGQLEKLLSICTTKEEAASKVKEWLERQKQIQDLRQHLRTKLKEFGLDPKDYETVRRFIDKLANPDTAGIYNITARYLGLMNKLSRNIEKFQLFIWKTVPGAKYLADQYSALRTMAKVRMVALKDAINAAVKKAIRNAGAWLTRAARKLGLKTVAKAIAQVFGLAAPIIGNLIAAAVVEVIMWLGKQAMNLLKAIGNFAKRLTTGELTKYFEEAERKLDKNARWLMYIVIILLLINALFSSLIGFLIPGGISPLGIVTDDPFGDAIPFTLSTFSPTDPTRLWGSIQQSFDWKINLGFEQIGGGGAGGGVGVGGGEIAAEATCFKFVSGGTCGSACSPYTNYDDWSSADIINFQETIKDKLTVNTGTYGKRICQAGDIYVHRSDVSSAGCRGYVISNNDIIIYGNCANQTIRAYLFAHESGHVYNRRFPDSINGLAAARATDHGSLPTYAGGTGSCGTNNNMSEDFAETVGDWIAILFFNCKVPDVGYTQFWLDHPGHKSFAETVLFNNN